MSLSQEATSVLGTLQQHRDPLSRNELANILALSEMDIVKAINELSGIYEIEKRATGYFLIEQDDIPDIKHASPKEQILAMLAGSSKRLYPRTFAKRLGLPLRTVDDTLRQLIADNIVHYRIPGTYFLSTAAPGYISQHYPGVKICNATAAMIPLEHDSSNYTFTISRNAPKRTQNTPDSTPTESAVHVTLVNIPEKINVLQQQLSTAPAQSAEHLQQLITFLQLHTEQAA